MLSSCKTNNLWLVSPWPTTHDPMKHCIQCTTTSLGPTHPSQLENPYLALKSRPGLFKMGVQNGLFKMHTINWISHYSMDSMVCFLNTHWVDSDSSSSHSIIQASIKRARLKVNGLFGMSGYLLAYSKSGQEYCNDTSFTPWRVRPH